MQQGLTWDRETTVNLSQSQTATLAVRTQIRTVISKGKAFWYCAAIYLFLCRSASPNHKWSLETNWAQNSETAINSERGRTLIENYLVEKCFSWRGLQYLFVLHWHVRFRKIGKSGVGKRSRRIMCSSKCTFSNRPPAFPTPREQKTCFWESYKKAWLQSSDKLIFFFPFPVSSKKYAAYIW